MRTLIGMHGLTAAEQDRINSLVPGWRTVYGRPDEIPRELFREAEIVFGWCPAVAEEGLAAGSKLRWVQSWSAGVDTLPLQALEERGIILTGASGVHPVQMTETVFAMLLAFSRNLHNAVRNQTNGKWDKSGSYGELAGKTIGIVGAGAIGTETARIAKAFGMATVGVRRSGLPQPNFDRMLDAGGLNELLAVSDVVVNILPQTAETSKLFGKEQFARMKRTAIFINVGRGKAVDTGALAEALREGVIAGAGLDVTNPEPLPEDHPLWRMDNVIITPHIGGMSDRYKEKVTAIFAENLQAYLTDGRPVRNVIDYRNPY